MEIGSHSMIHRRPTNLSLSHLSSLSLSTTLMKLAELLLQRVQLQKDLLDQAARIQLNAQVLEGEEPLEDPELVLKGPSLTAYCVKQMVCVVGVRTV